MGIFIYFFCINFKMKERYLKQKQTKKDKLIQATTFQQQL